MNIKFNVGFDGIRKANNKFLYDEKIMSNRSGDRREIERRNGKDRRVDDQKVDSDHRTGLDRREDEERRSGIERRTARDPRPI